MGWKRGSLRYPTSHLPLDDIGLLFVCNDEHLVLGALFIFSPYNDPMDLTGPRVLRSGFYNMPKIAATIPRTWHETCRSIKGFAIFTHPSLKIEFVY